MNKIVVLLLVSLLAIVVVTVQPVKSQSVYTKITITEDGSINPSDVPIQRKGDLYTFTGNINGTLDVQKGNIKIDGAGYKLQNTGGNLVPFGVTIYDKNNVTLVNTEIIGFFEGVVSRSFMGEGLGNSNCVISNNTITGGPPTWAMALWVDGFNNVISGNRIVANNGIGVILGSGSGNILSDNYIADNTVYGISFMQGSAVLRNNKLNNNSLGAFDFMESTYTNPVQDIDDSNTVDGMPVYYGVNQQNKIVPSNAGYVVLINSTRMTIQGLSIANDPNRAMYNSNGVYLVDTTDSVIANNTLTVGTGIKVVSIRRGSLNITIANNTLTTGIAVYSSNVSVIENSLMGKGIRVGSNIFAARNNLTSCETGIDLQGSNSIIVHNTITNCEKGISMFSAHNNTIYQNNFIKNSLQVYIEHYGGSPAEQYIFHTYFPSNNNRWDAGYPVGGNFWSDYNGTDANGDGIGDAAYSVFENDTDNYPLMKPVVTETPLTPSPSPSSTPSPSPSQSPTPSPMPSPTLLPTTTAFTTSSPSPSQQATPSNSAALAQDDSSSEADLYWIGVAAVAVVMVVVVAVLFTILRRSRHVANSKSS